jgi:hypothetical protein
MHFGSKIRFLFSIILFTIAFLIFPSFSFIPRVFSDTKDKFLQKVKITKDKATEYFPMN